MAHTCDFEVGDPEFSAPQWPACGRPAEVVFDVDDHWWAGRRRTRRLLFCGAHAAQVAGDYGDAPAVRVALIPRAG